MKVEREEKERVSLDGVKKIGLRVHGDFRLGEDWATFQWSTDGKTWRDIGQRFKMRFDYRRFFMGTKFAVFNYATCDTGGYVDVDRFEYEKESMN